MSNLSNEISKSIIGIGLIAGGAFLALAHLFDLNLSAFLWPLFIIAPGLLILVSARAGNFGKWVSVAGSMVLATGLLLAYQNSFDHFQSWAYAWALISPGAIGAGWLIHGMRYGEPDLVALGRKLINVSAVIFLAGAIFFELIINISGHGIGGLISGPYVAPAIIAGAGVAVLVFQKSGKNRLKKDKRPPKKIQ